MSKHHINGPSTLYRRSRCNGSMFAEKGLEEKSSDDANEGTMLHGKVVELWDSDNQGDLTDEQYDAVKFCITFAQGMVTEHCVLHFEEELSLFDSSFSVITYGTPDLVIIDQKSNTAILFDWKFGRNEVDAPVENLQMAAYSAMVMQEYGVDAVQAYIVQPRLSISPDCHIYTGKDAIVSYIEYIISSCESIDAQRVAGSHCDYCKARFDCSECISFKSQIVSLSETGITRDNIADLKAGITQIRKACDRADELLKQVVREHGGVYGGVELIDVAGDREADVKELYECVSDVFTTEEFIHFCKPAIGAIESEYATRMKDAGKVKTKKEARIAFGGFPCFNRRAPSEQLKIKKK